MPAGKRIVFSTKTPNDQGGIIPNDVIDFSRFNTNPVILCQHAWEAPPIGLMTDVQMQGGKWTGIPVFHGLTEESKQYKALYEANEGWIRACSIGGEAIWKSTKRNGSYGEITDYTIDEDGNRICEKFNLYEVSIVTLPSNPDAVTLAAAEKGNTAQLYEPTMLSNVVSNITKLSTNINKMKPGEVTENVQETAKTAAAAAAPAKTNLAADGNAGDELPPVIKGVIAKQGLGAKLLKAVGDIFHLSGSIDDILDETPTAKAPVAAGKGEGTSVIKNPTVAQPAPIGLSAKAKAKDAADQAAAKADEDIKAAAEMKAAAEADGATDELKAAYQAACDQMEASMGAAKTAAETYEATADDDEAEEMASGVKPAQAKATPTIKTNLAATKPAEPIKAKTMAELTAEAVKVKQAPQAKVVAFAHNKTISQFAAEFKQGKETDGARLMGRISSNTEDVGIDDYAALATAITNDPKFSALVDVVRFHPGKGSNGNIFTGNPQSRPGVKVTDIVSRLQSGKVEIIGKNGYSAEASKFTKLTATDTFLSSPDLFAIEFLTLAIFALFPATSWKNEIPIFGAQMSSENTGFVWANIAADPTIYKGSLPVAPSNYTYNDTAVALNLTPYALQPMLWTPLTMHQLRYDQMSTGWAQAFAKMGAYIDDELIYTLASTVPAASIVTSTGLSGYATTAQQFALTGTANNPNAFYWNAAYNGTLLNPVLNDIITIEQIYNKQNFDLSQQRATLVIDPTTEALLAKDPETKSLLTRWVNQNGGDFTKFKNTILPGRSRVAVYNTATGLVVDPYGSIAATCVSANLGFIPSQVGIGLGMLDVFMVQDPTSYGFKMSADTRVGITPLRANYNGTALYTYGTPAVGPV
jgi:hypothetical protein